MLHPITPSGSKPDPGAYLEFIIRLVQLITFRVFSLHVIE